MYQAPVRIVHLFPRVPIAQRNAADVRFPPGHLVHAPQHNAAARRGDTRRGHLRLMRRRIAEDC